MNLRLATALLCLALSPALLRAQPREEGIVLFKDGFTVKGKALQKRDFIVDPASGQSFTVPASNGFLYIDDQVRRIHFSPSQVQDVITLKPGDVKEQMTLKRVGWTRRGNHILPGWQFDHISDWDDKWERVIKVRTPTGQFDMKQRLYVATPHHVHGLTIGYNWDFSYLTREIGPDAMKELLRKYYADKKELKEHEKRLQIATFFQQAGWYAHAEKEFEEIGEEYPDQKEPLKEQIERLRQLQANLFVEEIETLHRAGQHDLARERLDLYAKQELGKLVTPKNQLTIQDIKTKYETLDGQLKQAKQAVRELSRRITSEQTFWPYASKMLLDELNLDTVPRVETFLGFAQQHLREVQEKRKPTQSAEQVLALAVTGWLQGNSAAETDSKTAEKLFWSRQFVLEYLKNGSPVARSQGLASFMKHYDVGYDVLDRLIRLIPPSHPYEEKIESEPAKVTVEAPDSVGGTYHVLPPPGYHPYRSYPVLLLLHSPREEPAAMVKRWAPLAAKHGFILAAPEWGEGIRPCYQHSAREHDAVIDALRDLRRRFNVDSDRVFLSGWEDGATLAFDLGLARPGLFAGVLPINGSAHGYPQGCWSNAQYLPFYLVEGDRNGNNPRLIREIFKDWVRGSYPSLYVEYKGRTSEWFAAEMPEMMDWMSRKKRFHPTRELGRYHTGGGIGEEFKTMRPFGNHFYWLSGEDVNPRNLNDVNNWNKYTRGATLQANVAVGNEAGLKGGAKVWTQINVRAAGYKQVTLRLTPTMLDLTKPVLLRVNGHQVGGMRTIQPSIETLLEELYATGDRQRPVIGKIDIRL